MTKPELYKKVETILTNSHWTPNRQASELLMLCIQCDEWSELLKAIAILHRVLPIETEAAQREQQARNLREWAATLRRSMGGE